MRFSETSAKTAKGVDEMIEQMVIEIMEKGGIESSGGMKLTVEQEKRPEKEGCC